jgi:hypothetical protein
LFSSDLIGPLAMHRNASTELALQATIGMIAYTQGIPCKLPQSWSRERMTPGFIC